MQLFDPRTWFKAKPKPKPKPPADLSHRDIFRYWNGSKWDYADPLRVLAIIDEHESYNPENDPKLVEAGDTDAFARTIDAVRKALNVEEFRVDPDGVPQGLSEVETAALMIEFAIFMDDLQKKTKDLQTSLSPTAEEPISSPSTDPPTPPTTPPSSGSAKTSRGPISGRPTPSDSP